MDDWAGAVCAELGIDPSAEYEKAVLNLTRVVAHKVDRPAAPVTAYLLGIAVGQGAPLEQTAQRLQQLAQRWAPAGDV